MAQARREVGQRRQHEAALGHARVRDLKLGCRDGGAAVEQDIDIDRARALRNTAHAAELALDAARGAEELPREELRFGLRDEVQEPALLRVIHRLGFVNGRDAQHADARGGQPVQSRAEVCLAVADIRAEAEIDGFHRRCFYRSSHCPGRLRYVERVNASGPREPEALPLHSFTPIEWGRAVLADSTSLLIDHAFLEKKAATNALELLTRWPNDWLDGWVETMTAVARDEVGHLAQVVRILTGRGRRLDRFHKNPYANSLRALVRLGEPVELLDRLLVAALIEARSCERFAVLAAALEDEELSAFYRALFSSEAGHYRVFLELAAKFTPRAELDARWSQLLACEQTILARQEPGPRIHSGLARS